MDGEVMMLLTMNRRLADTVLKAALDAFVAEVPSQDERARLMESYKQRFGREFHELNGVRIVVLLNYLMSAFDKVHFDKVAGRDVASLFSQTEGT